MTVQSAFRHVRVLVRGSGDLGSGVVYRLHRAGFTVFIAELAAPKFVRRAVAYGAAVYEGTVTVDGLVAQLIDGDSELDRALAAGAVPVFVDPQGQLIQRVRPHVVVDARMEKRALDTSLADARLVIGLGPGFEAGRDCHAVIETNRGHYLGRVIWKGCAESDTGVPGEIGGIAAQRVLRAPVSGFVKSVKAIGEGVAAGECVAEVSGVPVLAQHSGIVRGMIHPSIEVPAGTKIGDIDPRARPEHCFSISDKALAVGGGVLEALLASDTVWALVSEAYGDAGRATG